MHAVRLALALSALIICLGGCRSAVSETVATSTQASGGSADAWTPEVWRDYVEGGPVGVNLPDFSRAGYAMGERPIPVRRGPVFDVARAPFNAVPDDDKDDTAALQAAVDAAGKAGGGVVLLPKGRLLVHSTPDSPVLRITRDNVVLRGQGSGEGGSVLFLGAPGRDIGVRRLGTVPARQEARHFAAITITGSEERVELARITGDVARGERIAPVSGSDKLAPGMTVVVECHDEGDLQNPPAPPEPDAPDLPAQLTRPYRLMPEQVDTFGPHARRLSWITQVEDVPGPSTVRLAKPMRFDLLERHAPVIYGFRGVRGVGVEHLRIESAWPGGYRHHKPFEHDGRVVRTAREQDYLWNGIWISSAVHGWVRDVAFKDLTQGVILSRAAHITLRDLYFEGHDGHAGVTIGWSNDNLVEGAVFQGRMVHPVTVTMLASGNVFSDCEALYDGTDPVSGASPALDFHGMSPFENLFENMRGFNVMPGGDLSVMPHGGVRNVFWNVTAPAELGRFEARGEFAGDSFVQTWAYASTSSRSPATMHEHLPQAFYIGLQREEGRISVGGGYHDRRNQWLTVEGLNRPGLAVPSLREAQLRLRRPLD